MVDAGAGLTSDAGPKPGRSPKGLPHDGPSGPEGDAGLFLDDQVLAEADGLGEAFLADMRLSSCSIERT